ncbi:hypothetical protein J3998_02910 [Thiomicrorhabdus sp. 6S2-11]|jgi:hypothetical protein|uniref:Uncharacterized protein n=1 Tax=Thiomicrorhabdus marina TaxID=2818442 RepID=A0ABS3Q3J3_9GAMM|nr:hypothetical protein [Thiomicrorhabdus marina]MBO1926514.1 hypothetical protein [Thiomicrorhabdus marina]
MHYRVTDRETHAAKTPHHIFNINIIITHLFISMIVLEIGDTVALLLVPLISSLVIAYLYSRARKICNEATCSWFVKAHWTLAWRRGRILLISYGIALGMVALYLLFDMLFPGGFSMNNFSTDGEQTQLGEIITIRFAAVVIFVAVLITFMQTGISVYDAGKGIIDPKIEKYAPRHAGANAELGEGSDEPHHKGVKQMDESKQEQEK